jgi:hypothetical protein
VVVVVVVVDVLVLLRVARFGVEVVIVAVFVLPSTGTPSLTGRGYRTLVSRFWSF